ncbi:unnamed protein product [Peronospora destructor]|uniref:Uncharacterized protein n=1 Tax=Peronospora destructor TaxID=86335 RepID=A0AAV0V963_9STRA|nr:unnamed protein product [Peronospora destructor]
MERDAFQQGIDAASRGCFIFEKPRASRMLGFLRIDIPIQLLPLLCELKKETESHVVAVEEVVEPLLDNIKTKMSARLQKCSRSFSGALYPQSLLDRVECGNKVSKLASCLLQFGELERFEALLLMTSARNNQQSVDPSVVTQVSKAANKCSDLAASIKDTAEAQPRISAQIAATQKELAECLLSN